MNVAFSDNGSPMDIFDSPLKKMSEFSLKTDFQPAAVALLILGCPPKMGFKLSLRKNSKTTDPCPGNQGRDHPLWKNYLKRKEPFFP
jgi:hypothetical protein